MKKVLGLFIFIALLVSCGGESENVVDARVESQCVGHTCSVSLSEMNLLRYVNNLGVAKERTLSSTPISFADNNRSIEWSVDDTASHTLSDDDHLGKLGLLKCGNGQCELTENPTAWIFDEEGTHKISVTAQVVGSKGEIEEIKRTHTVTVGPETPIINITKNGNTAREYTLEAYFAGLGHEDSATTRTYEWHVKEASQDDSMYALVGNSQTINNTFGSDGTKYTVKLVWEHAGESNIVIKEHTTARMYPVVTITDNSDGTFIVDVADQSGGAIDTTGLTIDWTINGKPDESNKDKLDPTFDLSDEDGGSDHVIGVIITDSTTDEILFENTFIVTTPVKRANIEIVSQDDGIYVLNADTKGTGLDKLDATDVEYTWIIDNESPVNGEFVTHEFNELADPDDEHTIELETEVNSSSIGKVSMKIKTSELGINNPRISINTEGVPVHSSGAKNPAAANIVIDFKDTKIDDTWTVELTYNDGKVDEDTESITEIDDGMVTVKDHIFKKTLVDYTVSLKATKDNDSGKTIVRKASAHHKTNRALPPGLETERLNGAMYKFKMNFDNTGIDFDHWHTSWASIPARVEQEDGNHNIEGDEDVVYLFYNTPGSQESVVKFKPDDASVNEGNELQVVTTVSPTIVAGEILHRIMAVDINGDRIKAQQIVDAFKNNTKGYFVKSEEMLPDGIESIYKSKGDDYTIVYTCKTNYQVVEGVQKLARTHYMDKNFLDRIQENGGPAKPSRYNAVRYDTATGVLDRESNAGITAYNEHLRPGTSQIIWGFNCWNSIA